MIALGIDPGTAVCGFGVVSLEDGTLRQAARDMTETAVKSLEAGLASAEMRKQIDDLVTRPSRALAGTVTRPFAG